VNPRLPVVSGENTVRALRSVGFARISQRGSHLKLRNDEGRTVIVQMHRELAPGTLRSILRQAALSTEEFIDLL
jgi:predicted RNA binding protein YcfA (HicA-like mRNA interferase family)